MKIQPKFNVAKNKPNNQPAFGMSINGEALINKELILKRVSITNELIEHAKCSKESYNSKKVISNWYNNQLKKLNGSANELVNSIRKSIINHNKNAEPITFRNNSNHPKINNKAVINKIIFTRDPLNEKFQIKMHVNGDTFVCISEKEKDIAARIQQQVFENTIRQN